MTNEPSAKSVSFTLLEDKYGATDFRNELAKFIVQYGNPNASPAYVRRLASSYPFVFHAVPVYHKAKIWDIDFPLFRHASDEYDVIHASPSYSDKRNREIPGRFDTAIINTGTGGALGISGECLRHEGGRA